MTVIPINQKLEKCMIKIITSEHNQRIKNKGPSRKEAECGSKFTETRMCAKYTNDISRFLAISFRLDEQPRKAKGTDYHSVFLSFRND